MMIFMPMVVVLIGQFCHDVIGRQNVNVAVVGRLSCSPTYHEHDTLETENSKDT